MAADREVRSLKLFEQAAALEKGTRSEFVDRECAGDASLKARVEELLRMHEDDDSFLEVTDVDPEKAQADPLEALLDARPEFGWIASGEGTRSSNSIPSSSGSSDAIELEGLKTAPAGDGRYCDRSEIGRGGMGVVFRVWDDTLRRALAMKVSRSRGSGSGGSSERASLARFLEEARVTARLDHPGVVPLHDIGVDESGSAFFTMRLVDGRDLSEIFRLARSESEGWTPHRVLDALARVCDTLAYAHSRGVIHRDLKPSNIMIGRYGETYVMDWGLAKSEGRDDHRDLRLADERERSKDAPDDDAPLLTVDGAVVGTPAFMAPEQATGDTEGLDARADIYAIGSMLYTLLAGHVPYADSSVSRSPRRTLAALREGPPTPLDPSAPAELAAICSKAMARDPRDRYQSMESLAEELRAYREGYVVRAHRSDFRTAIRK